MQHNQQRLPATRIGAILSIVSLLMLACATLMPEGTPASPPRTPTPAAPPSPGTSAPEPGAVLETAAVKRAIQKTLDTYARAYIQNDADLLKQAVDQSNLPFRRFVNTRFENYQKSFVGGQVTFRYTVKDIRAREFRFVQARITTMGGYETQWLFREVDGQWLLSEPAAEQIGEPVIVEREFFTFYTYAWADDVNAQVIELMENARQRVKDKLGRVPDQKATVRIKPVYGLSPGDDPFAVAYYGRARNAAELDRIEIYAPNSYGFGVYDPARGWAPDLEDILTHEYTHMAHTRSFDRAGFLSTWMSEGLAEYVTGDLRAAEVRAAVKSGHIIPILDENTAVYKQDLMHLESLDKDRALAYGLAVSLVAYIAETYGGLDGFWKLARTYDEVQDFDASLQAAFGVTYRQFDRDWRAWLKKY